MYAQDVGLGTDFNQTLIIRHADIIKLLFTTITPAKYARHGHDNEV